MKKLLDKSVVIGVVLLALVFILAGLIRLGTRSGVTDTQVHETLPGDEIFPDPWISIDRAAVLPVSAEQAWPWVAQLGKDRGGWYAPRWLENVLHAHSATTTLPQFQNIQVGEIVPDWGNGMLKVLEIQPDQYVLYASVATDSPEYHFTWALVLENNTPHGTTFHLRLRIPRPTTSLVRFIPPSLPGLIDYATDVVLFAGLREKLSTP